MGVVTGPLRTVASEIAEVRQVKVKGMFDRPEDGGITLDDYAEVDYTAGVVTFEALPGAAVLKLDRVSGRVTTIKMIIPEEDCTLEDAVKAGGVADHVDSVRLSQIVHMIETTERNATNAATSAGVAKGHADRAGEERVAADSAAGRAGVSEANAKESEDNAKSSEDVASQAASAANASAGTATSKASEAGQYASSAQADAQTATTKAGEALASANVASGHASAADSARQGAVEAQGLAETAADEAGVKAKQAVDDANAARGGQPWIYHGSGTPSLNSYPGIKVGDYIVRKSDGQEWRVDA
ncbi:MAG: hypothetical protein Q4F10_06175 [Corynebacterium glutamicum]|nr:hypothetical protein [Corynebacterium glutamicum]